MLRGPPRKLEYRAFVLAHHPSHGYLALYSSHKATFQLPGGHLDSSELIHDTELVPSSFPTAAARELFEETGIHVKYQMDRLQPLHFANGKVQKHKRQYFYLRLSDADFPPPSEGTCAAANQTGPHNLKLKLRQGEHSNWMFVKDTSELTELVMQHSGGKVSEALSLLFSLHSDL